MLAVLLVSVIDLRASECRGLWVDAFHSGFWRTQEVSSLVADIRAMRCNTVLPEVRKRGDAYYQSSYEPHALRGGSAFDPLAVLIQKAHDTNSGPRVEVHAWMVAYPIWRVEDGQPPQTNHVFRLHQDWLDQSNLCALNDGLEYHLDPGHPEVQTHIFNVAMEIVSRYDVDGLSFDYLRYPGRNWGYNPVSVARFNRLYGQTGQPAPDNTNWMQFRRDQVTALLRKIYLSATAIKPDIKISAAAVVWAPVPRDDRDWTARSGAYSYVFQDWCGWMKEGILDINMPMLYLNHLSPANKSLFSEWVEFALAHSEDRHVVISPACYLNTVASTIEQIRMARGGGDRATHRWGQTVESSLSGIGDSC